jgi:PAS domain S-box-containing protein
MNIFGKILAATLPLVIGLLFASVGMTYFFSRTALTELAQTWLETRLAEAMDAAADQENILHMYGLEHISASVTKAKLDAGTLMTAINVGKKGYIFAVDTQGLITVHPDKTMVGMLVSGKDWFQKLKPEKGDLTFISRDGPNLAMYDFFEPWQWFILAADPEDEFYGAVNRMKPYMLYLVIFSFMVMSTALAILTRRLTKPLQSLTEGAERIGDGNLETRIAIHSHDEFGRLAQVFNQMAIRLQETLTTLKYREEHFRSLIENASDIILILDTDGILIFASPSTQRILGYAPEDLHGKAIFDYIHPDDRSRIREQFEKRALHTLAASPTEFALRHHDGFWCIVEATSKNLLNHPAVRGFVVNCRDITARKQAEEALKKSHQELEQRVQQRSGELIRTNQQLKREIDERKQAVIALQSSEKRMKAILRASPVGIGLIINRKLDWANEAMYRMVGYEKDSLIGESAEILYADPKEYERVGRHLYSRIAKSEIGQVESRWVRKDGTIFDCIIRAYSLDPQAPAKGQIVAVTDISDIKQLKTQLQNAKKMEAIGTLAGGVAHDLNNELSGIVSYPELLLLQLPAGSPLREPIRTIQKSGERAATIVQDLLTMARRGVAVTSVVNFNHIISELLKSPEFMKLEVFHPDVRITVDLSADLMNVKGSATHLSKTIMNLAANAAEAMPVGGDLSITSKNIYIDQPIRGYERVEEGDYVAISVTDTGVGIAEADRERIFEPFYTKKKMGRSGSGLGMAVVWGTVKDHNGYIDIESREGCGTTFTLYFPVTREEYTKDRRQSFERYRGRGEMVLVIDDSKVQRQIAKTILQSLGYQVASVASGEDAVTYLQDKPVDLLILDMIMEPGIDGLDTYRNIIKFRPDQKAIIVSGFSETERVKEAQSLGAGPYIKKPYSINKIAVAAKRALAR